MLEAKEENQKLRADFDAEVKERRNELNRQERRINQKEENLDKKTDNLEKKEQTLSQKLKSLESKEKEITSFLLKTEDDGNRWENLTSNKTIEDVDEKLLKKYVMHAQDVGRIAIEYINKETVLNQLKVKRSFVAKMAICTS